MSKTKVVQIRLGSSSMVNTPGLLRWAINGYKFKKDQKAMRKVIMSAFGLTINCVKALLSEAIPYTVEPSEHGGIVCFEYKGKAVQTPEPSITPAVHPEPVKVGEVQADLTPPAYTGPGPVGGVLDSIPLDTASVADTEDVFDPKLTQDSIAAN